MSKTEEGLLGVHWAALSTKALNLLPMTGVCQEALLQMALQSVLEKGVASLSAMPLHVATALHPQSGHFVTPIVMVEEMCIEITVIGTQTTEIILSAHHVDVSGAHQEAGALPDTEAGEVEVGAIPAALMVIVAVIGTVAAAAAVVLV